MNRESLDRKVALIRQRKAKQEGFPVHRMSDVVPESVAWLWAPYIPVGKLVMLEGDPGTGKSFVTARIACDVSRGAIPGSQRGPETVLMFSAEDGLADTLRPRLDLMGADVSRIVAIDEPLSLAAPGALDFLRATLAEHRPALVTVDPIVCYVGGQLDMHRANEVRSILAPIAKLAEEFGTAILCVRHLSKGRAGGRAVHAGLGSVDFTAAARSALLAGSAGDDSGRFAIVHTKSNLARAGESLAYRIGERGLEWLGASPLRATDLLGCEGTPDEVSERDDATGFISAFLAGGVRPASEVRAAGQREGLNFRTLQRAARRLGVKINRAGFGGGSIWRLPGSPDSAFASHTGLVANGGETDSEPKGDSVRDIRDAEAAPFPTDRVSVPNDGVNKMSIRDVRDTKSPLARGTEDETNADTVRV